LGLNIAYDITAKVGMKPSVQVAVSEQFVDPGTAVTINARGASIFSWTGENLSSNLGPQIIVRPTQTSSYTVTGSATDLCTSTATARVFVRAGTVTGAEPTAGQELSITPNPSDGVATLSFRNKLRGQLNISVRTLTGVEIIRQQHQKTEDRFEQSLDLQRYPTGVYLVEVRLGDEVFWKKIVKY
jgi:hypothetical protein